MPEHLVMEILIRLPLRDSVRTSILSRKWIYSWSNMPELRFDEECRLASGEETTNNCLATIVDHVLLLHNANIHSFRMISYLAQCNAHADKWILHLTRKNVEELCLEFNNDVWDEYTISSCLFSYKGLKVLSLECYQIALPPVFDGFLRLINVNLDLYMLTEAILHCLVNRCPLLEILKLKFVNEIASINIHAPKLKYFKVCGDFVDIVLLRCPKLVDVYIGPYNGYDDAEYSYNLEKFVGCLPLLEKLQMFYSSVAFIASNPQSLKFENLKFLALTMNFENSNDISAAFCIFRSSPKLESIVITTNSYINLHKPREAYDWVNADCVLLVLKKLEIIYMSNSSPLMDFVKYILANAPALEIMAVRFDDEDDSIDENGILKSFLSYPRASHAAKVMC